MMKQLNTVTPSPRQQSLTLPQLLVRGLAVGFVATQVLDIVSMLFYENLPDADRLQEDRTRGGHQAYEVMVKNIAHVIGIELDEEQIKYWGWKFHRSFGFTGGIQYMALRERYPTIGDGLGLKYGLGFFAVADELMIYLTRSTPGPLKFSWKAHARGAVAHIAYGVAAELTARTFDKIHEYEVGTGWALAEDLGRPEVDGEPRRRAVSNGREDVNSLFANR